MSPMILMLLRCRVYAMLMLDIYVDANTMPLPFFFTLRMRCAFAAMPPLMFDAISICHFFLLT